MSAIRSVSQYYRRLPALLRSLGASRGPNRSIWHASSSSGEGAGSGGTGREGSGEGGMDSTDCKPRVPLDTEWAELAKKQLKGADPTERLTWKTPEVSVGHVESRHLVQKCLLVTICTGIGVELCSTFSGKSSISLSTTNFWLEGESGGRIAHTLSR